MKQPRFFWSSDERRGCMELRKRASDYLESDIPEAEKERIRRHLEECQNCKGFLETLHATMEMLRELPGRAIPQSVKERLLQIPRNQGQG